MELTLTPGAQPVTLGPNDHSFNRHPAYHPEGGLYFVSDRSGVDNLYRWDAGSVVTSLGAHGHVARDVESLATALVANARSGDSLLIMSNGGFEGLHARLLARLAAESGEPPP